MSILNKKMGLIVGIANEHSLAYGCARHFHTAGAKLAIRPSLMSARWRQNWAARLFVPATSRSMASLKQYLKRLQTNGGALISFSIQLPTRAPRICMDVS